MSQQEQKSIAVEIDDRIQDYFEKIIQSQITRLENFELSRTSNYSGLVGKIKRTKKSRHNPMIRPEKKRRWKVDEENLLKECLLKQHKDRKMKEVYIRSVEEEEALHEEAKRLEEILNQSWY